MAELDVFIGYGCEIDEFWSYVGSKANPYWTWYAIERVGGRVVAYHNGRRTDQSYAKLLEKMADLPVRRIYTDEWGAYARLTPQHIEHVVGKDQTWKIERKNLNFRTHIKRLSRRTICFSKNEQIHDNVIGMYINKHYFKTGTYGDSVAA